jgi:NAD+ synthetase
MVRLLGVRYDEIAIAPAMLTFGGMLEPTVCRPAGRYHRRKPAGRIRGMILMALSNKTGSLVLTTGNKSEMAVGYCTLYGDMAGGFAVIKDIAKTWSIASRAGATRVVRDSRTDHQPPAVGRVEARPDRPGQLPPYEVLDAIVEAYMEKDLSPREIIARGYAEADVRRVVHLLKISEYKRARHRSASASRSAVSARIGAIRSPIATATPTDRRLDRSDHLSMPYF